MFIRPTGTDIIGKTSSKVAEFVSAYKPMGTIDPAHVVKSDVYVCANSAKTVDLPANWFKSITEFFG